MPRIDAGSFAAFNWAWMGLAAVVFVTLFFVTAPYGRHLRAGWGPQVPLREGLERSLPYFRSEVLG